MGSNNLEVIEELKGTIARMEKELETITHNKKFMDAAKYEFLESDTSFWLWKYKEELKELTSYKTLSMSKQRLKDVREYWEQWNAVYGLTSRQLFFNKGNKHG
jgi:hypothetical protein